MSDSREEALGAIAARFARRTVEEADQLLQRAQALQASQMSVTGQTGNPL